MEEIGVSRKLTRTRAKVLVQRGEMGVEESNRKMGTKWWGPGEEVKSWEELGSVRKLTFKVLGKRKFTPSPTL